MVKAEVGTTTVLNTTRYWTELHGGYSHIPSGIAFFLQVTGGEGGGPVVTVLRLCAESRLSLSTTVASRVGIHASSMPSGLLAYREQTESPEYNIRTWSEC